MVTPPAPPPGPGADPLAPLRSPSFVSELGRKAIHLSFIVLPLDLLFETLPWPRGRAQWTLLLALLALGALTLDLVRLRERRVRRLFRDFLGGMLREHERLGLLGSTYLLMAALLAVGLFPRPVAVAALGFTVLGDAFAAIVGKAWGRTRVFRKSLEGALGGLAACLAWAAFLALSGVLPWPVLVAGALAASLVELLPIPLDDNLGMTLVAALVMSLLWSPG
jgi:dolichol kinase